MFKFCRYNSELGVKEEKKTYEIPWNFAKFVVNPEGKVVSYHDPRVNPFALQPEIETMLGLN